MRWLLAVLSGLALALAGCGDDESDGDGGGSPYAHGPDDPGSAAGPLPGEEAGGSEPDAPPMLDGPAPPRFSQETL